MTRLVAAAVGLPLPRRAIVVSAGLGLELGIAIGIAACDVGYDGIENENGSLDRIRSRPCFLKWV